MNSHINNSFSPLPSKGQRQQVAQKGQRSQVTQNDQCSQQHENKGLRSQVAYKGCHQSPDHDEESCASGVGYQAPQICCLIDHHQRCHERVGVGSNDYTKRMQKAVMFSRKLKLKIDYRARHEGICDFHKTIINDIIKDSALIQQKESNSSSTDSDEEVHVEDIEEDDSKSYEEIDFSRFPLTTLLRYKRYFMIPGSQHSKADLSKIITKHFKNLQVLQDEKDIVADFLYKIKY